MSGARNRCQKAGLKFDLEVAAIAEVIAAGYCQISGLPFDLTRPGGRYDRQSCAPSLDRIDPRRGYVRDNVQVVVWAYNAAKSNYGHEDVMRLARALVAKEAAR